MSARARNAPNTRDQKYSQASTAERLWARNLETNVDTVPTLSWISCYSFVHLERGDSDGDSLIIRVADADGNALQANALGFFLCSTRELGSR